MGSGYEIARAIQRCVSHGHSADQAWTYTPRQLSAYSELIERERSGQQADLLMILRHSQSDKASKELLKKLREFAQ